MATSRATRSRATDTGHARDYAAIALAYAKRAAADKRQKRHCKWVRLAGQRHLDDLKRAKTKSWGYYFDPWHANDVCDFAEKLPHVEGVWDSPTIVLEPFQIFILAMVFGWRRHETGGRRFTSVYEEMARKNAKSTKTAIVSLYCLCCEDEEGPQVLTAATTFDQAKKVFNPAKRMVEKKPELAEAFALIPWSKSIECKMNGGYLQPMHAKAKSQDGHNPHVVTMDELHAHSDRALFDVMNSAFGARSNPLMWVITTAGSNLHGVCYEQRTLAAKVLERSVVAEHIFAIIFTLDRADDYGDDRKVGDDPYDSSKWIKANPLMEASKPLRDEVAKRAIEAQASPAAEGEFKTKHLNIWIGAASAWLNVTQWQACGDRSLTLDDFAGLDCYIGADLSNVDDLSAIVLEAENPDGQLLVKSWFFVPEKRLESQDTSLKQITDLYKQWVAEGALTATPGDFIDHRVIDALIRELKAALPVHKATFDQWNSGLTMAAALNEDLSDGSEAFAVHLAKNAKNATDPAKAIEARVKAGPMRLRHDDNPVLTWMIGNAVVDRRIDGSLLPKKATTNSPNKIDGVDAMINATAPMILPVEEGPDLDAYLAAGVMVA